MGLKCLYLLPLLLLLQGIHSTQGSCDSNRCKDGSTCYERVHNTYICLCQTGDYYDYKENKCISAKVFPGKLFDGSIVYDLEMANNKSEEFKAATDIFVNRIKNVYDDKPAMMYLNTTVLKIDIPRVKAIPVLLVTVHIMFDLRSPITVEGVKNDIRTLTVTALCPSKPCDPTTTTSCEEKSTGSDPEFTCPCKEQYVESSFSNRLCVVACPNGEKVVDGACERCPFGYTGFNCDDNWKLILVIAGSVLGAFLLITLIVLPVVVVTSKKKIKKAKTTNFEKPYSNSGPARTHQVNNGLAVLWPPPVQDARASPVPGYGGYGVPWITRAAPNDYRDRNPRQEMVPNNSRQNVFPRNSFHFDDHDDRNPDSRHMKQQNNLYDGGRSQSNPYASNKGYSNPYYRH